MNGEGSKTKGITKNLSYAISSQVTSSQEHSCSVRRGIRVHTFVLRTQICSLMNPLHNSG